MHFTAPCQHCERRPVVSPPGLCSHCDRFKGIRNLYTPRAYWTPERCARVRRLTRLAKLRQPLFN